MVKRPPRVPGVRSRLSSGQLRAHVSDYGYVRIYWKKRPGVVFQTNLEDIAG